MLEYTGIAIINGKVAAVGTDADVAVWTKSGISEVDLKGRTVAPGINDAHCHPLYLGLGLTTSTLRRR
ncbi:MAG: hypothetical protein R2849_02120 [Thermomicrobiales bacterium]